ncbi:MAG: alpha/beta hydrolase [Pseudomonadales bacterium]
MAYESIRSTVTSDIVPTPVEYALIVPDGFRAMSGLPLVLNLHGGGGNRERLFDQAAVWQSLWEAGAIPPAVVVMPSVTERSFYMNYHDGSERWEDFLVGPFLDHLRETYPVSDDAGRTFITGVSMGGMGSLRIAFRYPARFGAVAALEPGIEPITRFEAMQPKHRFWRSDQLLQQAYGNPIDTAFWRDNNPASMVEDNPSKIRDSGLQIYLEAGDEDQFWLYEGAEFLHQVLWTQRIPHEYHLVRGADHVGPSMAERLDEAIRFLFRYHAPWEPNTRMRAVDRLLDPLKARIDAQDHYNEPPIPDHYAESVMIGFLSEDGASDLSLRLARFPGRNEAHVWLHAAFAGHAWSVVDEGFALAGSPMTAVAQDTVTFGAVRSTQSISFHATGRNESLTGYLSANLFVADTRHPEAGAGEIPAHLQLVFRAGSGGLKQAGRWELSGRLIGTVTIDGRTHHIDSVGKWHEQSGPRARFAPAFTYLAAQSEAGALLVIGRENGAVGYAELEGNIVPVMSFEIEAEGPDERTFTIGLQDDRTIEGVARVTQRWSVPIEGKRRPGSSVLIDSTFGTFRGSLNDWAPD